MRDDEVERLLSQAIAAARRGPGAKVRASDIRTARAGVL